MGTSKIAVNCLDADDKVKSNSAHQRPDLTHHPAQKGEPLQQLYSSASPYACECPPPRRHAKRGEASLPHKSPRARFGVLFFLVWLVGEVRALVEAMRPFRNTGRRGPDEVNAGR
ncbi:UNVERIFIED_CONTAM: hypothetical protein K2H54_037640 [Gekko kuhli]